MVTLFLLINESFGEEDSPSLEDSESTKAASTGAPENTANLDSDKTVPEQKTEDTQSRKEDMVATDTPENTANLDSEQKTEGTVDVPKDTFIQVDEALQDGEQTPQIAIEPPGVESTASVNDNMLPMIILVVLLLISFGMFIKKSLKGKKMSQEVLGLEEELRSLKEKMKQKEEELRKANELKIELERRVSELQAPKKPKPSPVSLKPARGSAPKKEGISLGGKRHVESETALFKDYKLVMSTIDKNLSFFQQVIPTKIKGLQKIITNHDYFKKAFSEDPSSDESYNALLVLSDQLANTYSYLKDYGMRSGEDLSEVSISLEDLLYENLNHHFEANWALTLMKIYPLHTPFNLNDHQARDHFSVSDSSHKGSVIIIEEVGLLKLSSNDVVRTAQVIVGG